MSKFPVKTNAPLQLEFATVVVGYDQDEITTTGVITLLKDEQGHLHLLQADETILEFCKGYSYYRIEKPKG